MLGIVLAILTVLLIFVSLFLIMVILAQKSKDGGMGAALGGGAAEAAFGAETNTVLSKSTIYSSVLFFVLAFVVYLGRVYERNHARAAAGSALPNISVPAVPASNPTATHAPVTLPPAGTSAPAANATKPAPAVSSEPVALPATASTTGSSASSAQPAPAAKKP